MKPYLALYFPSLLIFLPGREINFLSSSEPFLLIALARSELLTEPNNLSPDPTFEVILISKDFIFLQFY